jgi:hypothetical protein
MSKSTFLISILTFFFISTSFSQEVTTERTINYLNSKFINKCKFDMTKDFTVEFIKDGVKYRQDKVIPQYLDPNLIIFIPEDNVIKISCIPGGEECFTRWIYEKDIKRFYNKLNIPVEHLDSVSRNGVELALKHLIRLSLEPKYKLYEFFE